jgi:hypothetical protein
MIDCSPAWTEDPQITPWQQQAGELHELEKVRRPKSALLQTTFEQALLHGRSVLFATWRPQRHFRTYGDDFFSQTKSARFRRNRGPMT